MQAAMTTSERKGIPLPLITTVLTLVAYGAHIWVREATSLEPGAPLRLAVTTALVIAFAVHVIATVRLMRSFDEFTKAIHFTAMAFAFPASMVALFAIGFFRAEGLLSEMDPRDLVGLMLIAYALGLTWAWRRYQA
jgi:hypothetical protein